MSVETTTSIAKICEEKKLPTPTCVIAYGMRDVPDSFARTLELAEGSGNIELLAHLLACDDCRTHIADREQKKRDGLVRAALERIKHRTKSESAP